MDFGLSKMNTRLDGVRYGFDRNFWTLHGDENEVVLYGFDMDFGNKNDAKSN
jgi:hypothetical protein